MPSCHQNPKKVNDTPNGTPETLNGTSKGTLPVTPAATPVNTPAGGRRKQAKPQKKNGRLLLIHLNTPMYFMHGDFS